MIMDAKKEKRRPYFCGGIKTFKWIEPDGNETAPDAPGKVRDADVLRYALRGPKD